MISLVAFFEGGVDFEYLEDMSVPKLLILNEEANRLNDERKKAMNRRAG